MKKSFEDCLKDAESRFDLLNEQKLIKRDIVSEIIRLAKRDINRILTATDIEDSTKFERDFTRHMEELNEELNKAGAIHLNATKLITRATELIAKYDAQDDPFMTSELAESKRIIARLHNKMSERAIIDVFEYTDLTNRLRILAKVMRSNLKFIS